MVPSFQDVSISNDFLIVSLFEGYIFFQESLPTSYLKFLMGAGVIYFFYFLP